MHRRFVSDVVTGMMSGSQPDVVTTDTRSDNRWRKREFTKLRSVYVADLAGRNHAAVNGR